MLAKWTDYCWKLIYQNEFLNIYSLCIYYIYIYMYIYIYIYNMYIYIYIYIFFFLVRVGWGSYCPGSGKYIIRLPSIFICIDGHTPYSCLCVRGWYPCGLYTRYISHCHIYRKSIFTKYLLGWQEWLVKQLRKQNKAGGKIIGKKNIKEACKHRWKGTKKEP